MTGVRYRALVVAVVIGAVVACLGLLESQRRHPHAFVRGGAMFSTHLPIGVPLYVGMSYDGRGSGGVATIDRVRANVVKDTAGTKFAFFACQVDGSRGIGAIGDIRGRHELERECLRIEPAAGASLRLGRSPMDQIVMAMTPTKPGRVVVEGVTVRFRRGWQAGSQVTGDDVHVRTDRTSTG